MKKLKIYAVVLVIGLIVFQLALYSFSISANAKTKTSNIVECKGVLSCMGTIENKFSCSCCMEGGSCTPIAGPATVHMPCSNKVDVSGSSGSERGPQGPTPTPTPTPTPPPTSYGRRTTTKIITTTTSTQAAFSIIPCSRNSQCSTNLCCVGYCRNPQQGICRDLNGDGVPDWVEFG